MIPVGKITALTQVSARADFTAFLARCAALRNLSSARSFHGLGRLATPSDFRARQSAGPTRPVLFVVGYRLGRPLPKPFRVLARRERYRLVASDPCLVTTTVLRCPLAVSRLLASAQRRHLPQMSIVLPGPLVCEHGNRAGGQPLWPYSALANPTHHRADSQGTRNPRIGANFFGHAYYEPRTATPATSSRACAPGRSTSSMTWTILEGGAGLPTWGTCANSPSVRESQS